MAAPINVISGQTHKPTPCGCGYLIDMSRCSLRSSLCRPRDTVAIWRGAGECSSRPTRSGCYRIAMSGLPSRKTNY
jgi:hypothetical protein